MIDQKTCHLVRLSLNQIHSNPILHSQRAFVAGTSRHDQERNQIACLLELQAQGITIFRKPELIRVEDSSLCVSKERVGVVGLVVDSSGTGYITRLLANPNPTWDVSADLPFRAVHLQNLLLKLLGEQGIDHGLPELLSFRIADTLGERCEGDSMDIAGLIAIVDSIHGKAENLFAAACACVSPTLDNGLEPSKSTRIKLDAFKREVGRGSLLIRHTSDLEAADFDEFFQTVWAVNDFSDLRHLLQQAGLIERLQNDVPLRPEQGPAITSRIESLMRNEAHFAQASEFIERLRSRLTEQTPLRIRLEVLYAEEDLHRHSGRFDKAIDVCHQRAFLENDPTISCYERRVQSDNRLAASLYDGHCFEEAIGRLTPWMERFESDPQICLPETRAIVMNTLSRCFVPLNDSRWESLLHASLAIQHATEPSNVSRTTNFLIHGYLKTNRLDEVRELLAKANGQTGDAFLIWLRADFERRLGNTCSNMDLETLDVPWQNHACGLILQALARQKERTSMSRLKLLQDAKRSFEYGIEGSSVNIKRLLAGICNIGIGFLENHADSILTSANSVNDLLKKTGLSSANSWYKGHFKTLLESPTWNTIDDLFERVPHF